MQKILVTGATGFLGKYIVEELVRSGAQVFALGRNEQAGKKLEETGAVFCRGDITDKTSCAGFFEGIDGVIHAGALSTVWGRWEDFKAVNVDGTRNICELCAESGVKRLVFVSSPSVYSGKKDRFNIKEDDYDSSNELNYYIKSKILAEAVIREFCSKGLYTVTIRPRGLFGIGDTSLVPRLLLANKKSGIPLFHGGKNYVDITCVESAAHACVLALDAHNCNGEVFNITNGEPMQFRKILEMFLSAIDEQPKYLRLPFGLAYGAAGLLEGFYKLTKKKGEPALTKYTVCTLAFSQTLDISKAQKKLGYKPVKTMSEGIRQYGQWWKNNQKNKAV